LSFPRVRGFTLVSLFPLHVRTADLIFLMSGRLGRILAFFPGSFPFFPRPGTCFFFQRETAFPPAFLLLVINTSSYFFPSKGNRSIFPPPEEVLSCEYLARLNLPFLRLVCRSSLLPFDLGPGPWTLPIFPSDVIIPSSSRAQREIAFFGKKRSRQIPPLLRGSARLCPFLRRGEDPDAFSPYFSLLFCSRFFSPPFFPFGDP